MYIDDSTFTSCTNLKSIVIPSAVTSVGASAFSGCGKLVTITTQSSTPPAASESSFDGVDKTTAELNVPKGSEQVYAAAKGWSGFRNIRGYEPTGVKAQISNIFSVGEKYYSPSGAKTGRLSRGLNIVKQTNNDGTVKTCKVLMK